MTKGRRILAVTAGLAVAGALVGSVAGAATFALTALIQRMIGSVDASSFLNLIGLGAGVGALFGLVLGPAAAWLLMRRVPIGRALLGTALGTIVGGVVALVVGINPLVLPLAGFFGSALLLRVTARKGGAKALPPVEGDDAG